MEFVDKAISDQASWNSWARPFRTNLNGLNGIRGQSHFSRTNLNGIRGQGHFGPTLMEFVGKAISDQA